MSCPTGNVRYPSPQAAHAVLERQSRRSNSARRRHALPWAKGRETAYRCSRCGGWHIGHEVVAKHGSRA